MLDLADIYKTAEAIPEGRWANAQWVMNRGTAFDIRELASALESGTSVWTDIAADVPSMLLGKGVWESAHFDSTSAINPAASADNFVTVVGDWDRYVIVRRVGMTIEPIRHLFGANQRPTGQRGFYVWSRSGAGCIDVDAFRMLSIPTTA